MSQQLTFDLQVDNKQAIDSINAFFDIYQKGVDGISKDLNTALGEEVKKKVSIELEGGQVVAKEVEQIDKRTQAVVDATKALNGELGKTPAELKRQLTVLKELRSNTQKYDQDTGKVSGSWKKVTDAIKGVTAEMGRLNGSNMNFFQKLVSAQVTGAALIGIFKQMASAAGQFLAKGVQMEELFIQLEGFTGSAESASAAYQKFVEIGQSTPFSAEEIAKGSRTMMGFGVSTSEATVQIEQLAIVAAATGGEIGHMARNLGQISANQRAYTRDLMQFANQGIPIYQELANVLGVNTQRIREMAEEGQIGFTEVKLAIQNMTREGSAFQVIADKMDETWGARLEGMSSAVDTLAGRFAVMVNELDRSVGGIVSGSMQLFISALNTLGKAFFYVTQNADKFAIAIGALAGAWAGLAISQWVASVGGLSAAWVMVVAQMKVVIGTIIATTAAKWAEFTAWMAVNAASGNFVALAAGAAVAAGAVAVATTSWRAEQEKLAEAIAEGGARWSENAQGIDETAFATEGLINKYQDVIDKQEEIYKETKAQFDRTEIAIKQQAQLIQEAFKDRIQQHKDEQEAIKEKMDEEKRLLKEAQEVVKEKYDTAIGKAKEELQAIRDKYDLELSALDEVSKTQLELEAIRRKEIEEKLKSNDLTKKERLELKLQLENMDKQVKRRQLLKEKAEEEKTQMEKINGLEADRKEALDDLATASKKRMDQLEEQYQIESNAIKEIETQQKAAMEAYQQYLDRHKVAIEQNMQAALSSLNQQITKAKELERAMVSAYNAAKRANEEAAKSPGGGAASAGTGGRNGTANPYGPDFRASGGPVTGGSAYTVNELGKEAFLSASGKLSMINAPAWGKWTAPSSGTVIPAHLTKQLDIPAGGVDINKSVGMRGMSASRVASSVKYGDNVSNNVTIQSNNPTQTANNVMVQLAKLKRIRYS